MPSWPIPKLDEPHVNVVFVMPGWPVPAQHAQRIVLHMRCRQSLSRRINEPDSVRSRHLCACWSERLHYDSFGSLESGWLEHVLLMPCRSLRLDLGPDQRRLLRLLQRRVLLPGWLNLGNSEQLRCGLFNS